MRLQGIEAEVKGKKGLIGDLMKAYIEILRPSVCALSAFAVAIGCLLAGQSNVFIISIAMLSAALAAGGGNVLNDIFDLDVDKINKPKRPLPSGRITLKGAKKYAAALLLIAAIGFLMLPLYSLALGMFNILVIYFYSSHAKRTPFASFVDSWLSASTFLFGSLTTGHVLPAVIILTCMAYAANVGRELAKAIEDMKGDAANKVRSLPLVLGRNAAILLSISFVSLAIVLSPLPFLLNIFNLYYMALVLVADVLFFASLWLLFVSATKSQKMMKVAMFIALLAFISGVF